MRVTEELAEKITSTLVSRGIVAEGDACLYKYGIESGVMIAANLLALLVFGLATGRLGCKSSFGSNYYWWDCRYSRNIDIKSGEEHQQAT